jgi:hypothetical protein
MKALCKQCGVEFEDGYSGVGRRKEFCGRKCRWAFNGHRYYISHRSKWAHINDKKEVKDAGASF